MSTARSLTRTDYRRLAELRYLLRCFTAFSAAAARHAGLTAQQHQALLAVKGSPAQRLSVGELAERLQLRHHSSVGLADRLVRGGLLHRRHDRTDQRRVILTLTRRGERCLARLSRAHREELRRLAPMLRSLLGHFGRGTHVVRRR
jgi:DNA-binding MarR family transcriptional regulator